MRIATYMSVFLASLLFNPLSSASAITIKELANVCEQMELAIEDISLEYEWHIIPSENHEQRQASQERWIRDKDNRTDFTLKAAKLLGERPGDTEPGKIQVTDSSTLINQDGQTWQSKTVQSWDGQTARSLRINNRNQRIRQTASIRQTRNLSISVQLTPLGVCTVWRPAFYGNRLSDMLRADDDSVRLDSIVRKVNEFNTIRVDFLSNGRPTKKVYFSVDHGYTPVKYEYTNSVFEAGSLREIAPQVWFPDTAQIITDRATNLYIVSGEIRVNQGLGKEDFNIEFPAGTEVTDEIKGRTYVIE